MTSQILNGLIKGLPILGFLIGGVIFSLYLTHSPFSAAADRATAAQTRRTPKDAGVFSTEGPIAPREMSINSAQIQKPPVPDEIPRLVEQIREALQSGDISERNRASTSLLPELIKQNPKVAAALSESLPSDGSEREEMLRRTAQYWAAVDVIGARQWAEQLSDARERDAALVYVCAQVAHSDPQLAVQMADQYGLERQADPVLEDLVQRWAEQDFSSAITWVRARPASEKKDEMVSRLAVLLAKTSPAEAAQIVAVQIPEGAIQMEAAISVLHQWMQHDLVGARAWVELFPKSSLRERALKELNGAENNGRKQ